MKRRFYTLDVFTEEPLAGNPLAVVRDCEGLDDARMQAIAREFNLSETVFVLPPRDPVNTARLRIFTPTRELPFAGHPTIGAAVLIGLTDAPGMIAKQDVLVVLEEEVGPVACTVGRSRGRAPRARFTLPRLPEPEGVAGASLAIAAALCLREDDIGFDDHAPAIFSAGNAFCFVPVASRAAIARAQPDPSAWPQAFGHMQRGAAFLYTRECERPDSHFHARMFAPGLGVHAHDRWTHYYPEGDAHVQLDYILLSPRLAAANPHAVPEILRMGLPWRVPRLEDAPRYPRIGWARPKASDHCPVVIEIDAPH